MKTPHPRLPFLLQRHGLTFDAFVKRGRPTTPGLRDLRSSVITELHQAGVTWDEMAEITGLSLMGIQRLTKAKGNPLSVANRKRGAPVPIQVETHFVSEPTPQLPINQRVEGTNTLAPGDIVGRAKAKIEKMGNVKQYKVYIPEGMPFTVLCVTSTDGRVVYIVATEVSVARKLNRELAMFRGRANKAGHGFLIWTENSLGS